MFTKTIQNSSKIMKSNNTQVIEFKKRMLSNEIYKISNAKQFQITWNRNPIFKWIHSFHYENYFYFQSVTYFSVFNIHSKNVVRIIFYAFTVKLDMIIINNNDKSAFSSNIKSRKFRIKFHTDESTKWSKPVCRQNC